jgi:hypothetical protein
MQHLLDRQTILPLLKIYVPASSSAFQVLVREDVLEYSVAKFFG